MKLKQLFNNLMVLGCALTITAVGCKHKSPGVTPLPNNNAGMTGNNNAGNGLGAQNPLPPSDGDVKATSEGITPTDAGKYANYIPHPEILEADSIHFDFDKSAIKANDESKLKAVADYMKSNPEDAVRVEGNCDERGTEEYNRSLGERRALAAREYLARLSRGPRPQ
jgi:outer membrane protein OmpA-like peptidoglycan-associated protein